MAGRVATADRSILLCGLMGVGKSSVARALAERLGWRHVDTDDEIVREAGRGIPEIFASEGESGFRTRERAVLAGLPERGCVIALGGGAVASPENREILATKGVCVWLHAPPEALAARIGADAERPLLAGLDAEGRLERLRQLAAERSAAYRQCPIRIETADRDVAEVCDAVLEALRGEAAS